MDPTYLLMAAGLFAAVALLWRTAAGGRRLLFTRQPSLLTASELRFYYALLQAVPPHLTVQVKVRLLDVVTVPADAWRPYGAKGSGMHLDFVIATAAALAPCLAIELDDRRHAGPAARQRDQFKDAALSGAQVPLLRIATTRRYDTAELRDRIQQALLGDRHG